MSNERFRPIVDNSAEIGGMDITEQYVKKCEECLALRDHIKFIMDLRQTDIESIKVANDRIKDLEDSNASLLELNSNSREKANGEILYLKEQLEKSEKPNENERVIARQCQTISRLNQKIIDLENELAPFKEMLGYMDDIFKKCGFGIGS